MVHLTRRSLLRSSAALIAGGAVMAPRIGSAAAKTATVWWTQGFAQEEDVAFKKLVADYEKASGNTIDYTIIPYAPLRQKIISAVTSGSVPDLFQNTPPELMALQAWAGRLVDVTDVIETQKGEYNETALLFANCYDGTTRKRSYYGVPYTTDSFINHIWRSLVEKAGYKMSDLPKTWDAFYDFFKGVQKKLRDQGMRHVYGLGFQLTANGGDPNNFFNYFLIAYGGENIVGKDGKLHLDDPQVRKAAIAALTYPTTAYKEGYVPSGAINWNDADDNNAFHSKEVVMDLDGSLSTEVAIIANREDYDDIVTMPLALSNDGKPVPALTQNLCGLIPKGAQNITVAKDFLKYLIQPAVLDEYLKTGLGRRVPPMPSIAKKDPWWLDPKDPHRVAYTTQLLFRRTVPDFFSFNPAYARVENEHVWQAAWADIVRNGTAPDAAADKAFKRIEDIFAEYPIT
ncbi:MAG TPA: ABC transporter substrate-binding protein [Stellaceae bacterium]|nr:ABC transporter substrate-binding protein [Stellaceae bacterium]